MLFRISLSVFEGCRGRFGRGASLYRFRSQLFVRLWAILLLLILLILLLLILQRKVVGTIPTADRAVF